MIRASPVFLSLQVVIHHFRPDHATASFAIAVVFLVHRFRGTVVLLLVAAIISFSRIYIWTHYVSDVVGGALSRILVVGLVWWVYREGTPRIVFPPVSNRYARMTFFRSPRFTFSSGPTVMGFCCGHDNLQRSRPSPIIQRWLKLQHFSIERDVNEATPAPNDKVC